MKRLALLLSLALGLALAPEAHAQRTLPGMRGLEVRAGMADGWNLKQTIRTCLRFLSRKSKLPTAGILMPPQSQAEGQRQQQCQPFHAI